MKTNITELEKNLCAHFCTDIKVSKKNDYLIRIETPFHFPDGDPYQIYLKELETGGYQITDAGHTLMHISYENDLEQFRKGTRAKLFDQIKLEMGIKENNGEIYLESMADDIHSNIFILGQALTKIYDLTFLSKNRVENTFYEDLREFIYSIVEEDKIQEEYIYDKMENAQDYIIDYYIQGKSEPLFLFGILNKEKAKLTTIILERLIRHSVSFESIIVFSDFDSVSKSDAKRLMNVAGEMITSLDAREDLKRKIVKRVA